MRTSYLLVAAALLTAGLSSANATFITPSGWTRGDPNSTFQQWDRFSSLNGPNDPNSPLVAIGGKFPVVDGAPFNPNGNANTYATNAPVDFANSTGAFVITTGSNSRNIYSPFEIIHMVSEVPNYNLGAAYSTHFLLQVATGAGFNPNDADSFKLDGTALSALPGFSHTRNGAVLGDVFEDIFQFDLPGNAATYSFTWSGSDTSAGQDLVSIDTFTQLTPVPEPASLGILGFGIAALLIRRR